MRWILAFVALLLLLVLALGVMRWMESRTEIYPVRSALRQDLASRNIARYVPQNPDSTLWRVLSFYRKRRFIPAWMDGRGDLSRARELLLAIDSASVEGLDPADYRPRRLDELLDAAKTAPLGRPADPQRLAELDVLLTCTFLRYGSDLMSGRVNPARVPADWHTRPPRADWIAALNRATGGVGVKATLAQLEPAHPEYRRLKEALRHYRTIQSHGGWPRIPTGPALKRGSRGLRLTALRQRLASSADLPASAGSSPVFDRVVEAGVRRFQIRHGLDPTGVVREGELAELNVPVSSRIRQIELNMERWRWLPPTLGSRYIVVNIPDFSLELLEGDRSSMAMRVVVGKEYSRTPIFSDTLAYVVFNPTWNIPASIAVEELGDSVRVDARYLAKHHMHVYDGQSTEAHEVDVRETDLGSILSEHSNYSLRQDPGPDNPLGKIKFLFPNRFNIYLHDTPAGHLFDRRERDFSHGCIRIEHPVGLAEYLLPQADGWGPARVAAALDSSEDAWVRVPHPIPVHILYWTAWVDRQGVVQFRDDLYGIDDVLARALRDRPSADVATAPRE